MFYLRLLFFLLALVLTSCATVHNIPAQVQRRHYSRCTRHYHRVHGQTLRHPQCFR